MARAQSGVCDSTGIKLWATTQVSLSRPGFYSRVASIRGQLLFEGEF